LACDQILNQKIIQMKILNKKIVYSFLLMLGVIGFDSCKKLDLQPRQSIEATTALSTADDVDAGVVGCYSIIGGANLYGESLNFAAELLASSGNCSWVGTFTAQDEIFRKNMQTDNGYAGGTWVSAYQAINMANNVLSAINVVTDPEQKNQLEGEALFIRGTMHFELVRLYAKQWDPLTTNNTPGVPIKITPTKNLEDASVKLPRNTVAEVYQQVITDLTAAATKLPEENPRRATKYSALAMLSRVYLQKSDFAKARDAANAVIQSGYFQLSASVLAPFTNKNTSESIFEIQQNDQNNAGTANNGLTTFYASLVGIGRGDLRVSGTIYNSYSASDVRKAQWYYTGVGQHAGALQCGKWLTFSTNIPVMRLSEMYLTRAECNLRLGTAVGNTSDADYNIVRARAGLAPSVGVTLNTILTERRLELAFEGLRIHDLRRNKLATGSFAWDANELVFPIPQFEINVNDQLTQNPGY
jgi:hypothetical protein